MHTGALSYGTMNISLKSSGVKQEVLGRTQLVCAEEGHMHSGVLGKDQLGGYCNSVEMKGD